MSSYRPKTETTAFIKIYDDLLDHISEAVLPGNVFL